MGGLGEGLECAIGKIEENQMDKHYIMNRHFSGTKPTRIEFS